MKLPTDPKSRLIIAVALAGLGFAGVVAEAVIAARLGHLAAPWAIPAAWLAGALLTGYGAVRWLQFRAYTAIQELQRKLVAQRLAAQLAAIQKRNTEETNVH